MELIPLFFQGVIEILCVREFFLPVIYCPIVSQSSLARRRFRR